MRQWTAKDRLFSCVAGFAALVCFQVALSALNRYLQELTRSTLENRLKERLFSTLLGRDYGQVSAIHSGEWMNRLTSDTVVVADGLAQILPGLTGMVVRLVGAVAVMIMLDLRFFYVILPVISLLIFFSQSFRKVMKRLHRRIQEQDGKLRSFLQESIESLLVVRSFGAEAEILEEAGNRMDGHKQARMKRNRFSNLCNSGFTLIINAAYVLGALFCGYGILTGTMSYGTFTAVLQLIGQIRSPLSNIGGFPSRYYAMIASAERLMEAEQISDNGGTDVMTEAEIQAEYADNAFEFGFLNASFSYRPLVQEKESGTTPTIQNLTLHISKGSYVAFVGPSGCGKSTLLKLLMCLYPLDCGERYICADGKRQALTVQQQKLFAYVPQGLHLMSGTIREIVSFSQRKQMHDDEQIRLALRTACAEEFVDALEKGVDTLLGEHGQGLSEGQLQRLAIARAVFSNRPV